MRLDWRTYHLIVVLSFLLTACGQVGTITGGNVDERAPAPISEDIKPPLGSLNIQPSRIVIPFDEYVALNNPSSNISITPNDVVLDYSISGKSLVLSVKEGEWSENTTYSIYLNRAVKDITESNDSIMHYVFSTGPFIDSLKGSFLVQEAYKKSTQENITIGLYEAPLMSDTSKERPKYYSSTNKRGKGSFNYLKNSAYYVYAFDDENRNNRLDPFEMRGALSYPFNPLSQDTIIDTILLMPPQMKEVSVRSNEFAAPGIWCIGFNKSVDSSAELNWISGELVEYAWNTERDSLTVFVSNGLNGNPSFALKDQTNNFYDTISKRFFFEEAPKFKINSNLKNGVLIYVDTLSLKFNDPVSKFDTSLMACYTINEDSTKLKLNYSFKQISPDLINVLMNYTPGKEIEFTFGPGSINGHNLSIKDTLKLSFKAGLEKEVGSIIFESPGVPEKSILMLYNEKGELVHKSQLSPLKKTTVSRLLPGTYSYAVLIDKNEDGEWSTGDIFTGKEPELIHWVDKKVTVRGNWEIETTIKL